MEHILDEYIDETPEHALVGEQRDGGTGTFREDTQRLAHRLDSVVAVPDRCGSPTHAGGDRTACSRGTDTPSHTSVQRRNEVEADPLVFAKDFRIGRDYNYLLRQYYAQARATRDEQRKHEHLAMDSLGFRKALFKP